MKTIKELEVELQFDGFSNNDIEEAKIEVLKDVLKLLKSEKSKKEIIKEIEG